MRNREVKIFHSCGKVSDTEIRKDYTEGHEDERERRLLRKVTQRCAKMKGETQIFMIGYDCADMDCDYNDYCPALQGGDMEPAITGL